MRDLNVDGIRYQGENIEYDLDLKSPSIVRDANMYIVQEMRKRMRRRTDGTCHRRNQQGFNTMIKPTLTGA